MIEIRGFYGGYYLKVGNEVYQLDQESVTGGENWKIPLNDPPSLEHHRLISQISFAKVGDKATEEARKSLPSGSVIADGDTMLVKQNDGKWKRWDVLSAGNYHPTGDRWIVAVVGRHY